MTLQELYENIHGDYDQALRVLRVEKLLDKHIRKFIKNRVVEPLIEAGKDMDPNRLFETSHAVKGVAANLGLKELSERASEISEEFRPGNPRQFSDREMAAKLDMIDKLYQKTAAEIRRYGEDS